MIKSTPLVALRPRILRKIKREGEKGITRTGLMQFLRCPANDLSAVLQPLVEKGEVREWTDNRSLGRPATRYFDKDVVIDLAAMSPQNVPASDLDAPQAASICKTCGVAIEIPDTGHPFSYCSDQCRRNAKTGGETLREFLFRNSDPRIFGEAAILLVMMDLTIRGFHIGRSMLGSRVYATDETGKAHQITILPVNSDGTFANMDDFESAAAVFRDGKIIYGGKDPIIKTVALQEVQPLEET